MSPESDYEIASRVVDEEHKTAKLKLAHLCNLAETIAPSFRDKFDFSEPKHFDAWAEIAFTAAEALVRKQEALLAEEHKRWEAAHVAANNAFKAALSKATATAQEAKS